ncbi:hypothetical protein V5O48_014782 [Marasmius crinis-equi]|uniref:Uncharacterized protein n=1 Tax=Marasmius crinis-equi TaxID=585013 RepID=A0ABR3EWB6_9AGAR
MDIHLSNALVAQHPNTAIQLPHVITREQSDDLFRVVTTPTLFQGRKSIAWSLSQPAREGTMSVDVSRVLIWIDPGDIDGSAARVLEDDIQLARSQERKVTVLFLGFHSPGQKDALSMLIPRLEMRYRTQCIECQSISEALEQVYLMSLAINPYHVVHQNSPLFTNQAKLTYIRMLLQLDGVSVPNVKGVTEQYPSWSQLMEHLDTQVDLLEDEDVRIEPWLWERLLAISQ